MKTKLGSVPLIIALFAVCSATGENPSPRNDILGIGVFHIGQSYFDFKTEEPSAPIQALLENDSGTERNLLFVQDTLRAILTTYDPISSNDFESSSAFKEMFAYFQGIFGPPQKVESVHSDRNFSKKMPYVISKKKVWTWKNPKGMFKLVATTTSVDTVSMRLTCRIQAQISKRIDSEPESEAVLESRCDQKPGNILSKTIIQSQIWQEMSGENLAKMMSLCLDHHKYQCGLPDDDHFDMNDHVFTLSSPDVPESWYQLKSGKGFIRDDTATIEDIAVTYKHPGQFQQLAERIRYESFGLQDNDNYRPMALSNFKKALALDQEDYSNKVDRSLLSKYTERIFNIGFYPAIQSQMSGRKLVVTKALPPGKRYDWE